LQGQIHGGSVQRLAYRTNMLTAPRRHSDVVPSMGRLVHEQISHRNRGKLPVHLRANSRELSSVSHQNTLRSCLLPETLAETSHRNHTP
jgi:hypothetical protein